MESNPSELLVTGGAGYIGSHLLKKVSALCLDQRNSSTKNHLSENLDNFDPRNPALKDIRTVVHLADRRLYEVKNENLKQNIETHSEFFKKISTLPKIERVIFSSSCSVYGFSEETISEMSSVNPTSHYAESKLATENALKDSGLPHLILRFGTAYGWSSHMRDDLFLNELCKAALEKRKVDVYAPSAWRPYIHSQDFAGFLASSIANKELGLNNVVTENFSKYDVLKSRALQKKGLVYQIIEKGDPRNYRVTIHPQLTNPLFTVEKGLEDMLERLSV